MTLTPEIVEKIAKLARLKVQPEVIQPIAQDLSRILDWVAQLEAVDTKNVEPLSSVYLQEMPMRKDETKDGDIASEILQNAPEKQHDMFVVPRVVE